MVASAMSSLVVLSSSENGREGNGTDALGEILKRYEERKRGVRKCFGHF